MRMHRALPCSASFWQKLAGPHRDIGGCTLHNCTLLQDLSTIHHDRIFFAERPIVVHHDWDPSDPADPVFIVLPDGGLSLAYQQPTSPSQKSIAVTDRTNPGSPRSQPRCHLPMLAPASIRSCICAPSPAQRAYSADSGSLRDADSPTDFDAAPSQDGNGAVPQPVTLAEAATGSIELDTGPSEQRGRTWSSSTPSRRRSRSARHASAQHARRGVLPAACVHPPAADVLKPALFVRPHVMCHGFHGYHPHTLHTAGVPPRVRAVSGACREAPAGMRLVAKHD